MTVNSHYKKFWQTQKMNNDISNEIMYLVIFSTLSKLYRDGSISKEVFNKLNSRNADIQGCKPIVT